MKVSLVVVNAGKLTGQTIPITLAQFIIGRDPQCNLRPASAVISKRHCAVLVRDGKIFLKDFDSTNGTFLNDEPVKGEVALANGDMLKVGPLQFKVAVEVSVAVDKPTPPPPAKPTPTPPAKKAAPAAASAPVAPPKSDKPSSDEDFAALLLGLDDGSEGAVAADESGIPSGSTVMDIIPLPPGNASPEGEKKPGTPAPPAKKDEKKDPAHVAAAALLQKMSKRPRAT